MVVKDTECVGMKQKFGVYNKRFCLLRILTIYLLFDLNNT